MLRLAQILRKAADKSVFPKDLLRDRWAVLILDQLEYIQSSQHTLLTAGYIHPVSIGKQAYRHVDLFGRLLFFVNRQHVRIALRAGVAQLVPRASFTRRRSGTAVGCAQLHQRLIVVPGSVGRNAFLHQSADFLLHRRNANILAHAKEARRNAVHIAIHRRHAQAKGNAADSACRIGANAGQSKDLLIRGRKHAAVLRHNNPCGLLQISCSAVISEPFPCFKHLFFGRISQLFNRWKKGQKTGVIPLDRLYARLLQHNLRQPDMIGILRPAPRQIPFFFVIPCKKQRGSVPIHFPSPFAYAIVP